MDEKTTAQIKCSIKEYRELHRFYYRRKMELIKQLKEVSEKVVVYEDKMEELANLPAKLNV